MGEYVESPRVFAWGLMENRRGDLQPDNRLIRRICAQIKMMPYTDSPGIMNRVGHHLLLIGLHHHAELNGLRVGFPELV
jgi:hypothetical protein